jgi:hypothetical protein
MLGLVYLLPAAAVAAELETLEVRNLKPMEASGTDVLIRVSSGTPHFNLIPATDENLKVIPHEMEGDLAASCLGEGSDFDGSYRYDTEGVRFDFGFHCDNIFQKVIVKGYTEGRVEKDRVELHSQAVQISATDPDFSLTRTISLKLDGKRCSVETFQETTQVAGWPPKTTDLVTRKTTCSVQFAQ